MRLIHNFLKLVIAIAVSELAGVIGAFFTTPAIQSGWYAALAKPALYPPSWVFGPVWIILYALMGLSVWLVWEQYPYILEDVSMLRVWRGAIFLFFLQLVLNALWSIIFFGLHSPGGAWLLLPYIFWVSFAISLNYAISFS